MEFNDIFKHVFVVTRYETKTRHRVFTENMKHTGIDFSFHFHGTNPCYKFITTVFNEYISNHPTEYLDLITKKNKHTYRDWYVEVLSKYVTNKTDNESIKILTKPGYLATTMAHIELIQRAKNEGWENIVIFEDDTITFKNFKEHISPYLENIPKDWQILRFGNIIHDNCNFHNHLYDRQIQYVTYDKTDTPMWMEDPGGVTLPCYAIHNSVYDIILEFYSENYAIIDMFYSNIANNPQCYSLNYIKSYLINGNVFIPNPFIVTNINNRDILGDEILNGNATSIEQQMKSVLGPNQLNTYDDYFNILTDYINKEETILQTY